jgi:hypothetical protein
MNRAIAILWMCGICLFGGTTQAATITYTATDLVDNLPGQDVWQYRYTANGSFVAFGGFDVFFDASLYSLLQDPAPAVNNDWSINITQPIPALPAAGIYTATAFSSTPSLANEFTLNFVWLGAGRPGSQSFDVFDDTFLIIDQGSTSLPRGNTPVPEPASLFLIASSLLLLRLVRKLKAIERPIA